jgi:hypothetical protein
MPTRRQKETTPDLFSASTTIAPPTSKSVPEGKSDLVKQPMPRHILPKDLAGSLTRLDDAEFESLLAAVTEEAKRRNLLPSSPTRDHVAARAMPRPHRAPTEGGAHSLTKGQLNAVRAAFKAGVRPSAIARQFGISQSIVKKALAYQAHDRESGR